MEANQDRQRLAAVLETLARVLRSEAEMDESMQSTIESALMLAEEFLAIESTHDLARAEGYATKAAKLAGVEVSEEKKP